MFGWLPDRFSLDKRRTLSVITAGYCLCWLAILPVFGPIAFFGLAAILLVMGFMIGGFISAIWGLIRQTTPLNRLGLMSGLLNPAPFLGVAVFQVLTGRMIERAGRIEEMVPLVSFSGAFGVCLAGSLICLMLTFFIRSKPVSPD